MENQNFKISAFRFDNPQEIELCYTEFKPSDKFKGSFNTQIIHNGVKKWWGPTKLVVDRIKELGAQAGDRLILTRKEGGKGQYTEISLPGGIETQSQNLKPREAKGYDGVDDGRFSDDHPIPMEAYMPKNNSTDERFIRGMCFNNACSLL